MSMVVTGTETKVTRDPSSTLLYGLQDASIVGTSTVPAALSDDDDTTYVQGTGGIVRCRLDNVGIPGGARVAGVRANVKVRKEIEESASFVLGVGQTSKVTRGVHGAGDSYGLLGPSKYVTALLPTTATTYSGPIYLSGWNDEPFTQRTLNLTHVLFGAQVDSRRTGAVKRYYKAWLDVWFDHEPIVSNIGPSLATLTASPLITWDYEDDLQAQSGYDIQIFSADDDSSAPVYTYKTFGPDGKDTHHQMRRPLPNGKYWVWVRAAQYWNIYGRSGDSFWSDWTLKTMTLDVLRPGAPELSLTPRGERIEIAVQPNLNLLGYDESTIELGVDGWDQDTNGLDIVPATSFVLSGEFSLRAEVNDITDPYFTQTRDGPPVIAENTRYLDNVVGNSGLETDTTEWFGFGGAIERSTDFAHTGEASLKVTPDGSTTTVEAGISTSFMPEVDEQRAYRVSAWVYNPSAGIDEIANPGFENNTSGWQTTNGTVVRDSGLSNTGVACGRFDPEGSFTSGILEMTPAAAPAATPNAIYEGSIWIRLSNQVDDGIRLDLVWRDASDVELSVTNGDQIASPPWKWWEMKVRGTAPANTASVALRLTANESAGLNSVDQFRIDDAAIVVKPSPISVAVRWRDELDGTIETVDAPPIEIEADTWTEVSFDAFSPVNAAKASPRVWINDLPASTNVTYIDDLSLEPVLSNVATYHGVSHIYALNNSASSAEATLVFYNELDMVLQEVSATTPLSSNTWTKCEVTATPPLNAAMVRLRVRFTGTSVGNVFYVDNLGLWSGLSESSPPVWARGGFYPTTKNLLSYSNSTFEADDFTFVDQDNSADWVKLERSDEIVARNGHWVMKATEVIGGGNNIEMDSSSLLPVTPGEEFFVYGSVQSASTSRTAFIEAIFYDASFFATSWDGTTATTVPGDWVDMKSVAGPAPDSAVYVGFRMGLWASDVDEVTYWDHLGLFRGSEDPGWMPGAMETDGPYTIVEYSEDGEEWQELSKSLIDVVEVTTNLSDYEFAAYKPRLYRARVEVTVEGQLVISNDSPEQEIIATLSHVWMHFASDPAETSYNFYWDGAGRDRTIDSMPQDLMVEGRTHAIAEFSHQSQENLGITLQLANEEDIKQLDRLARHKGLVVFRDQRGRRGRGTMGPVNFQDTVWGQVANFTFKLAGNQP